MKIEDIQAKVKPRNHWQAADFGIGLLQSWAKEVYIPFMIVICSVFLLFLPFVDSVQILPMVVLWWLKPLWGRIVVFVLSRSLFGAKPQLKQTLRELPGLLRYSFVMNLTIFRFSVNRASNLPVLMLENTIGTKLRARYAVISRGLFGFNITLTFLFLIFEWGTLFFGGIFFIEMLIPSEMNYNILNSLELREWYIINVVYLAIICFLEPIYAAIGFACYINRRTQLECWDVELAFRKLGQRILNSRTALLLLLIFFLPIGLKAEPEPQTKDPKQVITEVMSDPIFERTTKTKKLVPRFNMSNDKKVPKKETNFAFFSVIAEMARIFIWIFMIAAVIIFLYYVIYPILKAKRTIKTPHTKEEKQTEEVNIRELELFESLPENILQEAQTQWNTGKQRLAMSYLFRGALLRMAEREILTINEQATEGDCIRLVQKTIKGDFSQFFAQLTLTWQRLAYGHKEVSDQEFQQLCHNWQAHLGGGS